MGKASSDEKRRGVMKQEWSLKAMEVEMERPCPTLNAIFTNL